MKRLIGASKTGESGVNSQTSSKRSEALLNEYKGNIYEFLVANSIAKSRGLESDFMRSVGSDFYSMLGQQENFIREYYPKLLEDLPVLAKGLAERIEKALPEDMNLCRLIGKTAAGLGSQGYGEGDILTGFSDGSFTPVSVKLSKAGAFVNTKSAGVKSFLSKYFGAFADIQLEQESFGAKFDRVFDAMAFSLHEKAQVEYDPVFANWREIGLTQLPGELSPELREVFLDSLYQMSNHLCETLRKLAEKDGHAFLKSAAPLLGYSRADIAQATTFYVSKGESYILENHVVETGGVLERLSLKEILNRDDSSSFDLIFQDRILQIRLKAMNKFTGKGFKVNCAVKSLV